MVPRIPEPSLPLGRAPDLQQPCDLLPKAKSFGKARKCRSQLFPQSSSLPHPHLPIQHTICGVFIVHRMN